MHTAQLMPLPLTVSCFSKIQIGFTFLVPAHPGSPGKRAVKRVCVCESRGLHFYRFNLQKIAILTRVRRCRLTADVRKQHGSDEVLQRNQPSPLHSCQPDRRRHYFAVAHCLGELTASRFVVITACIFLVIFAPAAQQQQPVHVKQPVSRRPALHGTIDRRNWRHSSAFQVRFLCSGRF